jgi:hypothetical protein
MNKTRCSICMGSILVLLLISTGLGQTLLSDSFTSVDTSKWTFYHGSTQTTSSASISTSNGSPAPCLLLDDGLNNGAWAVSKQTFAFSGKTTEFSAAMQQGNAAFSDQRNAVIGISKTNHAPANDYLAYIAVTGSSNPNSPNTVSCVSYYLDNGTEKTESRLLSIGNGDAWHNAKIGVDPTGLVSFFLDDMNNPLFTSSHSIDSQYSGQMAFSIGGRKSYYDTALVTQTPEPATLTILVLGGLAVIRRRKA